MREPTFSNGESDRDRKTNRRSFLQWTGLGALSAAAGASTIGRAFAGLQRRTPVLGRGNAMPGRIVLVHDTGMQAHLPTINRDQVEAAVHDGVRLLTEVGDTAAAFESLFPGLESGSTIAIKVNCLGWNDTRWEVVRGIVSGLSRMFGGTYNVSQVTIYDVQTNLPDHGYLAEEFTFNGQSPIIRSSPDCGSYYVYANHRLSNYVLNSDYLINVPVLKAHNAGYPEHLITTAFKNNYGSLCPQNLCNNIPGMLTVNSDPEIREKTALVVTSALRGTYNGGPWEAPQLWQTFEEETPNHLFLSTDPVTEAYWAREMINAERLARGYEAFDCPWIEEAAAPPYDLGIADPDSMTVVQSTPAGIASDTERTQSLLSMEPCHPNPFSSTTEIRFRLAQAGTIQLLVISPSGQVVRHLLCGRFAAGERLVSWDGRDDRGRRNAAGVYFARLTMSGIVATRRIVYAP